MTGSSHVITPAHAARFPATRRTMTVLLMLLGLVAARAALAGPLHGLSLSSASVAPSSAWEVSLAQSPAGGAIYPGQRSELLGFTVTNVGQGGPATAHLRAAVASDPGTGDALTSSGAPIRGCLASWFVVTPLTGAGGVHLPQGASAHGSLRLSMIDAPVNQDACRGADVAVQLSAS